MSRSRLRAAVTTLLLLTGSAAAYAQSEAEIIRPLDGATVRERVRIIVPGRSVPAGGFVAYFIGDRFRSALSNASENDGSYVYVWDTKAMDPNPNLSAEQRKPREGKHTIKVEICGSSGKKVGTSKEITVYVRNNASSDMPAGGIRLLYKHKAGAANDYEYKVAASLKSIRGAREVAATVGEAFEGTELTIKRSIEDIRPDKTALIRQKPVGTMKYIRSGRSFPMAGVTPRAAYHIEDQSGRVSYVMGSRSPGLWVTVDFPNLPTGRVAIGDTWTARDKVFRDAITGKSIVLNTTSTLDGLEWEGGYPCAKIRTTFSGVGVMPFPSILAEPMNVSGETITYFAYQVGKVISSVTTGTVDGMVDESVASSLTQKLVSAEGSSYASSAISGSPTFSGDVGGPSGFETPPPSFTGSPGLGGTSGRPGTTSGRKVSMAFAVTQSIQLVR